MIVWDLGMTILHVRDEEDLTEVLNVQVLEDADEVVTPEVLVVACVEDINTNNGSHLA